MADCYRTPGGWTVEVVRLAEGERLRIRQHGFHVADVGSVDGLARRIPAAELERLERDTLILPVQRPRAMSRSPGRASAGTRPMHPSARQATFRCPGPRGCLARAGLQSHVDQLTLDTRFEADR